MQNLSVLFETLETSRKTKNIDGFILSELTLNEQREILNTIFNPIETPVKVSSAFDKIIIDCVKLEDETINIKDIKITKRPMIIRALRNLSFSETFKKDGEDYRFCTVTKKDIEDVIDEEITINDKIKVKLSVPSIKKDLEVNKNLAIHIESYRRRLEANKEIFDASKITDIYYLFELIRFIDSISFDDKEYLFADMVPQEQIRALNSFPQNTISQITEYSVKVHKIEEKYFTAQNVKTKEKIVIPMDHSIFSNDL